MIKANRSMMINCQSIYGLGLFEKLLMHKWCHNPRNRMLHVNIINNKNKNKKTQKLKWFHWAQMSCDLCIKHGINFLKPNQFMISIEAWKKGRLQTREKAYHASCPPFIHARSSYDMFIQATKVTESSSQWQFLGFTIKH